MNRRDCLKLMGITAAWVAAPFKIPFDKWFPKATRVDDATVYIPDDKPLDAFYKYIYLEAAEDLQLHDTCTIKGGFASRGINLSCQHCFAPANMKKGDCAWFPLPMRQILGSLNI